MNPVAFTVAFVCLCSACLPTPAAGQEDFTAGGLRAGDHVLVTSAAGIEAKGTVTDVSSGVLILDGVQLSGVDVERIDRLGDPLWNGALIGALVGALAGQDDQFGCSTNRASRLRCARTPAIALGLLGGLLDYARVGRHTVFERSPRVTVSAGRSQVNVTLSWND